MTQEQFNAEQASATLAPANDFILCVVPKVTEKDPRTGLMRIPAQLNELRNNQIKTPMVVLAVGQKVDYNLAPPGHRILAGRAMIMDSFAAANPDFEYVLVKDYEVFGTLQPSFDTPSLLEDNEG